MFVFMLNSHASIHGSSKTPHEFLSGKNPSVSTRPITSMVLCELPQSAQADDRPRFLEGAYLRPEFNSKSRLCLVMLDGVLRKIHPKSIKLVLPMRWERSLLKGFCVEGECQHKPVGDSAPADAVQKVRLSDSPPTEEQCVQKAGHLRSGLNSMNCTRKTAQRADAWNLVNREREKVHSASCCANYVRWLRTQRQEAAEAAERERESSVG